MPDVKCRLLPRLKIYFTNFNWVTAPHCWFVFTDRVVAMSKADLDINPKVALTRESN